MRWGNAQYKRTALYFFGFRILFTEFFQKGPPTPPSSLDAMSNTIQRVATLSDLETILQHRREIASANKLEIFTDDAPKIKDGIEHDQIIVIETETGSTNDPIIDAIQTPKFLSQVLLDGYGCSMAQKHHTG